MGTVKKMALAMCAVLVMGMFAACGNNKRGQPDFKSVYDEVTGETISLGESRESIEKKTGAIAHPQKGVWEDYDLDFSVGYDDDNKANMIMIYDARFRIMDFDLSMDEAAVREIFPVLEISNNNTIFCAYFAKNGERTTQDKAAYFTWVVFRTFHIEGKDYSEFHYAVIAMQ